jgi:hypothetical protein
MIDEPSTEVGLSISQRMPRLVTGLAGVSSRPKLRSHYGGEPGP